MKLKVHQFAYKNPELHKLSIYLIIFLMLKGWGKGKG